LIRHSRSQTCRRVSPSVWAVCFTFHPSMRRRWSNRKLSSDTRGCNSICAELSTILQRADLPAHSTAAHIQGPIVDAAARRSIFRAGECRAHIYFCSVMQATIVSRTGALILRRHVNACGLWRGRCLFQTITPRACARLRRLYGRFWQKLPGAICARGADVTLLNLLENFIPFMSGLRSGRILVLKAAGLLGVFRNQSGSDVKGVCSCRNSCSCVCVRRRICCSVR
jgi:hypothetical protein